MLAVYHVLVPTYNNSTYSSYLPGAPMKLLSRCIFSSVDSNRTPARRSASFCNHSHLGYPPPHQSCSIQLKMDFSLCQCWTQWSPQTSSHCCSGRENSARGRKTRIENGASNCVSYSIWVSFYRRCRWWRSAATYE